MSSQLEETLTELHSQASRIRESLRRYGVRHLRNLEDAEDFAQNIMLKILTDAAKYDPRRAAKISTWAIVYAKTGMLDLKRASKRERQFNFEQSKKSPQSRDLSVEESYSKSEEFTLLRSNLFKLSNLQYEIVKQFYFGGKSYKEISAELGVSLGTVRSRLNCARNLLRKTCSYRKTG